MRRHYLFLAFTLALTLVGSRPAVADQPAGADAVISRHAPVTAAETWRQRRLNQINRRFNQLPAELAEHPEWRARREWLAQWVPGEMDGAEIFETTDRQADESSTEEPNLNHLAAAAEARLSQSAGEQSAGVSSSDALRQLQQAARQQKHLWQIDDEESRKKHLAETIELSKSLDQTLQDVLDSLPTETETETDDGFRQSVRWALAHTRYRRARALAYRELPEVLEETPIRNRQRYERKLRDAHRDLRETFDEPQSEFVLLEIRMLRRAGDRGQALQKLERFRERIEPKWYLKKRRDLLEELGWDVPYREAARLYQESGLADDEPNAAD